MAESELSVFCRQVRKRSEENKAALELSHREGLVGNVITILRGELDSMVRCIFLLSIADREYRRQLIKESVNGRPWRTKDGRRRVTDRAMVDLSTRLHGWSQNVYAFGCGFIHLSAFHDYSDRDPLNSLTTQDRAAIGKYLSCYHGVRFTAATKFREIKPILPAVFDKISSNLECYVRNLEADLDLEP